MDLDLEAGIQQVRTLGPRTEKLNLFVVIFLPHLIPNDRRQVQCQTTNEEDLFCLVALPVSPLFVVSLL